MKRFDPAVEFAAFVGLPVDDQEQRAEEPKKQPGAQVSPVKKRKRKPAPPKYKHKRVPLSPEQQELYNRAREMRQAEDWELLRSIELSWEPHPKKRR